ncbi:hypothetical protein H5410_029768 [Solanum commersonii]|uniref:Uncharacterized protein n=1 Tax=Solanum commersonii TaxID=4109 RepID=A0A9J5YHB7_SOLCO|nr:hypothetical protein H5410_029768 [Solanum commersonii]
MSTLTPIELDYGGQSCLFGPTWERTLLSKLAMAKKSFFWKDNWDGQDALQEAFPSLFNISTNQNNTIENIWTAEG